MDNFNLNAKATTLKTVAFEDGSAFMESKNGKNHLYQVETHVEELVNGGYLKRRYKALLRLAKTTNPKPLKLGTEFKGYTIFRKWSHNPFYEGQKPVINPDTEEVTLRNGKVFYDNRIVDKGSAPEEIYVETTQYAASEEAEKEPEVKETGEF